MATRKPNYAFERNQRTKAKAAKRQAKQQAKTEARRRETPGEPAGAPSADHESGSDAAEVLVSEVTLYDLGVRDDADLEAVVGRTVQVDVGGVRNARPMARSGPRKWSMWTARPPESTAIRPPSPVVSCNRPSGSRNSSHGRRVDRA